MNKTFSKDNNGFTLIETLVGLMIFLSVVTVLVAVSGNVLSDINASRQKISAQYLAEEGIEYTRHVRDSYVIQNQTDPTLSWTTFRDNILNKCNGGQTCDFNVLSGSMISNPPGNMTYNTDSGYTGRNQSISNEARYNRLIEMEELRSFDPNIVSVLVTATVSWEYNGIPDSVALKNVLFFNIP